MKILVGAVLVAGSLTMVPAAGAEPLTMLCQQDLISSLSAQLPTHCNNPQPYPPPQPNEPPKPRKPYHKCDAFENWWDPEDNCYS